jgi:hypothetical protein
LDFAYFPPETYVVVFPLFVTEVTVCELPGDPLDDDETNDAEPPFTPPSSLKRLEMTPPPTP